MTKKLRRGYTTGTCAQAATKAAVTMLLGNVSVDQVTVSLPGKEVLTLKIAEAQKEFNKYRVEILDKNTYINRIKDIFFNNIITYIVIYYAIYIYCFVCYYFICKNSNFCFVK